MPDEKQEKLEPCPVPECGGQVTFPVYEDLLLVCETCGYGAPNPAAHNQLARAARERDALRKELCEEKEVALGLGRDLERETQRADKAETALRERDDDLDRQSKIVDDLRWELDEARAETRRAKIDRDTGYAALTAAGKALAAGDRDKALDYLTRGSAPERAAAWRRDLEARAERSEAAEAQIREALSLLRAGTDYDRLHVEGVLEQGLVSEGDASDG